MTVAALVQALELVGQVYRNQDGSQQAEAVKKILQQLKGAGELTLAEWAKTKQKKSKTDAKQKAKPKAEPLTPEQALARLKIAETQAALREAMARIKLSADQWKTLAKDVTGRRESSGPTARAAIETHFSDRLLLDERIESVKRQFG